MFLGQVSGAFNFAAPVSAGPDHLLRTCGLFDSLVTLTTWGSGCAAQWLTCALDRNQKDG